MIGTKNMLGLAMFAAMGLASVANAQTTITLWDFNAAGLVPTGPAPSVGTGTASLIGGVVPTTGTVLGFASDNGSSDPTPTNSAGAWTSTGYPAQGTASGTAGLMFAVDCTGRSNISFEFDAQTSTSPAKHWNVEYSTTGVVGPWTPFVASPTYTFTATGFGSNNNIGNNFPIGTFFNLPAAADNNANVAVRIVAVFDPANNATYTPVTAAAYATGGTFRVDMVEFRDNTPVNLPPGISVAAPATLDVRATCVGTTAIANYTVNVTAGANPASVSYTVTGDFSALGGTTAEPMIDLGGGAYGIAYNVPNTVTAGIKTITFKVVDDQARQATVNATFGVGDCSANAASDVVIAQIFGGGGGGGVGTNPDYVVLHNRGCAPVDINGWSLQYGTATGTALTQKIDMPAVSTIIPVGGYYLIETSAGANPIAVPADLTANNINMGGISGRVAIVNTTTLVANPVTDPSVKDFVGFGNFSLNFEGAGSTVTGNNASAYFRKNSGNQDTNQNFNDFEFFVPAPVNSTSPAVPNTCLPACPADLDNGSATGTPDGGVDINDLLYFLTQFEAGNMDLDNDGVDPQLPDGGTDINDLLFFLFHFEAGC